MDKTICKYFSYNNFLLSLLSEGKIYLSKLYTNDPLEGKFFEYIPTTQLPLDIDLSYVYEKLFYFLKFNTTNFYDKIEACVNIREKWVDSKIKEAKKDINVFNYDYKYFIEKSFEIFGISSFTKNSYNHNEMWIRYGDADRGVCIEFDKDILLDSINKILEPKVRIADWEPYFPVKIYPVNYTDFAVELKIIYDNNGRLNVDNYINVLTTKYAKIWSVEEEERLIKSFDRVDNRLLQFDKSSITKVIFGEKLDMSARNLILSIINNDPEYSHVEKYVTKRNFDKIEILQL